MAATAVSSEFKSGALADTGTGARLDLRDGAERGFGTMPPNYETQSGELTKGDLGFRVLKIDTSNMKEVYYTPDAVTQEALPGLVDNIRADRTPEDLLFQVLLDWGVDLALPISQQTIAGKTVFFVDGNALAACFDTGIDEDFVKQLATHKPLRVVFRDAGFVSDSVKINVEQVFKLLSPATEIKTL
jgi:adenine-specific DNA-methyltransferase